MGQSPVLKLSTVAMGGGRKRRWGSHLGEGGIAQDDAHSRRTSSRSRPVGTTELPGKGFSIQKALRYGARNLHELDVSADEF
jgi:hypothetical protein